MTFELPHPPSSNTAYACVRGRKIKTKKAREYAAEVEYLVADHLRTGEQPPEEFTGQRLAVHIRVNPPDRRRRDLVSSEKVCTDAVMHALGLDDSQIDLLTLERGPITRPHGSLTYTITTDERAPF